MLQLGWKAGTEQYGPNALVDLAIAAEAADFDSIDASDHFHPWAEKGEASFVWSVLGAIAARTSRITLGTGVAGAIERIVEGACAKTRRGQIERAITRLRADRCSSTRVRSR